MEATKHNKLKPNDVAIVLRPSVEKGKTWNGDFQVMISGVGPVTMKEDDFQSLIHIAMVLAAGVPLMQEDEEVAAKLIEKTKQLYHDSAVDELEDVKDASYVLSKYTKTIGGVQ